MARHDYAAYERDLQAMSTDDLNREAVLKFTRHLWNRLHGQAVIESRRLVACLQLEFRRRDEDMEPAVEEARRIHREENAIKNNVLPR